jgi:hypothetical protein
MGPLGGVPRIARHYLFSPILKESMVTKQAEPAGRAIYRPCKPS